MSHAHEKILRSGAAAMLIEFDYCCQSYQGRGVRQLLIRLHDKILFVAHH
jgi:hypothetical protein